MDISLREYIEAKLLALDNRLDTFIEHSKDKFASQNEFRGALSDQARELLPRGEYAVQHKALVDRVDVNSYDLSTLKAEGLGRSRGLGSLGAVVLGALVAISALCSVATVIISILRTAG